MESQLQRPVGHAYDQDLQHAGLHSVVEGEGEHHHHGTKSVLKKVKDKAKKIKEILKKDGHGHEEEHERDYAHGDHDEYEGGDDEDEEMLEGPEVHGAPMYESAAIRSSVPAQVVNLEKPTAVREDDYDAKMTDRVCNRPAVERQSGESLGKPSAMDVSHSSEDKNVSFPSEVYGTKGVHGGLVEDPHAGKSDPGAIPPANYEAKVADPSGKGGKEAGISPLIRSFGEMKVSEEKPGTESEKGGYTGSHDQFSPQTNPTEGEFGTKTSTDDDATGKSSDQRGYAEKISAATSVIADKAISAKNVVASKLGYGSTEGAKAREMEESKDEAGKSGASASPTGYVNKVAATVTEKLAPVYEKVAGVGSSVVSKTKGSEIGHEGAEISSSDTVPDKGVSVKEYVAEKLKPGEEDKALSEVISDTLLKKKGELVKTTESKPIVKVKTDESKPIGKVTESEAVARHLGSGLENKREGDDAIAAGKESSGEGVMDRLKEAVSSWMSKGSEQQYSKGSPDPSYVSKGASATGEVEHQPGITDERRLQESGN